MDVFSWLNAISADADPARAGFQARWLYIATCVVGPAAFGATVALLLYGIERVFGIKLSKGGGH